MPTQTAVSLNTPRAWLACVDVSRNLLRRLEGLAPGILSRSQNMPRKSSGGRSARAAPRPSPVRNAPKPANPAPPPAPAQGGGGSMLGGLGATIAEGMAFGTGSAIAHRAVDALMGPRTIQHETVVTQATAVPAPVSTVGGSDACGSHSKAFQDCLNNYGSEISKCQFYLDMLTECRRNSGGALSA